MAAQDPAFTHATVLNENATLHYWYTGSGPLFTFIPGGNGHARQYFPIMKLLSSKYTVLTFDRRQMSSSTVEGGNKPLDMEQQARDVLAVIKAIGFDKSIIFGNSLGALIAFQFTALFPSYVTLLLAHEGPASGLIPEAEALKALYLQAHSVYLTSGIEAAMPIFAQIFVNYPTPDLQHPEEWNQLNFFGNELLQIGEWERNSFKGTVEAIKRNGTKVGLLRGEGSGEATYARAVTEQGKLFGEGGAVVVLVPGHHQGFENQAVEFEKCLLEVIDTLEKK